MSFLYTKRERKTKMAISKGPAVWVLVYVLLLASPQFSSAAPTQCDLTVLHGNDLYTFSLAHPTSNYPHGILSEDGFYKVAVNETVLWFQLCDPMIFNHDPPRCFGCEGCGGETRCGGMCSALVATNEGGYDVCQTIGHLSTANVALIDVENPGKGVILNMSSSQSRIRCSLTVSVNCDPSNAQAIEMKHPSGCATITSGHGSRWGWLGTLILILICMLGVYVLAGAIYRFLFLGIRGTEVIPNLQFWLSLPHSLQNLSGSVLRRVRRFGQSQRSSYGPVSY